MLQNISLEYTKNIEIKKDIKNEIELQTSERNLNVR